MAKRKQQRTGPVLIMAGGTGGHVFPGLAVAEKLAAKNISVEWLGTQSGIEARVVPMADIPLHFLPVSGIRGKGLLGLPKAIFNLLRAQLKAIQIVRKMKPRSVLGMGGFAAGPGGVAAKLLGVPLFIHEQNAVAGTTNRILSKFATQVLQAFASAFENVNAITVGNPIRQSIVELGMQLINEPRQRKAGSKLNILIVGGSLGAQAINQVMPQTIEKFTLAQRPNVRHQTGKAQAEQVAKKYKDLNVDATVHAFIDDMQEAYQWADVVVCRAGALTVSELSIVGLPAIYIPLPHAIDDHQTANAKIMENAGAGIILPQSEMTEERLHQLLSRFINEENYLEDMRIKSRSMALPFAADKVVEVCLEERQ